MVSALEWNSFRLGRGRGCWGRTGVAPVPQVWMGEAGGKWGPLYPLVGPEKAPRRERVEKRHPSRKAGAWSTRHMRGRAGRPSGNGSD